MKKKLLSQVKKIIESGKKAALISVLPDNTNGDNMVGSAHGSKLDNSTLSSAGLIAILGEDGEFMGSLADPFIPLAQEALRQKKNQIIKFQGKKYFADIVEKPWKLIICGAGHIALSLAPIAKILDFSVTVIDCRPNFANAENFPNCDELITGDYRETLSNMALDESTAVVIVTHGHIYDLDCLKALIGKKAGYIGMIGSRAKVALSLKELLKIEGGEKTINMLNSPIGIDISAETPGEIAISIMAELISAKHGISFHPSSSLKRLDRTVIFDSFKAKQ